MSIQGLKPEILSIPPETCYRRRGTRRWRCSSGYSWLRVVALGLVYHEPPSVAFSFRLGGLVWFSPSRTSVGGALASPRRRVGGS